MSYQLIHIRQMCEDDIPDVVELERASFTTPWSEMSFRSELYSRYSIALVAESNGIIVGYICAKHIADEGHLLTLAVRRDYRKMGIAKRLVENVIRELRADGCRFFYLEVRSSNYAAKRLYEGLGFKTKGIRKNYYVYPTEDAVIMMLEL